MTKQTLIDWLKEYLKYKDTIKKEIEEIKTTESEVIVQLTDKEEIYLTVDKLEEIDFQKYKGICSYNTKENLELVEKQWDELIKNNELLLILVNKDLSNKLVLRPYIHNKITEPGTLGQGLKALSDGALGKIKEVKKP